MKFIINKDSFLKQISLVQGIVDKRNTIPILSNVLINAYDNYIDLLATDLEVGIKCTVNANVENSGSTTVSAKKLFEIIREFPNKDILFEKLDKDLIRICCDKIYFTLICISPEEFPSFPIFNNMNFTKIEEKVFKEMIDKTIYAASYEESHFSLNSIFLEINPDEMSKIRFVATDGHRLAMIDRYLSENVNINKSIIIPKKGFQEIRKLLSNSEEKVNFGLFENNFVFQKENIIIFIRLLLEEFPDYKDVVKKENKNIIIVNRENIIESLKRISILSTEKFKSILFDVKENIVRIYSSNPDIGEAEEFLEIKYIGEPLSIAFNAKYLLDIFNILKSEYVRFELNDPESPCIIRTEEDVNYLCVVMPMRI